MVTCPVNIALDRCFSEDNEEVFIQVNNDINGILKLLFLLNSISKAHWLTAVQCGLQGKVIKCFDRLLTFQVC